MSVVYLFTYYLPGMGMEVYALTLIACLSRIITSLPGVRTYLRGT